MRSIKKQNHTIFEYDGAPHRKRRPFLLDLWLMLMAHHKQLTLCIYFALKGNCYPFLEMKIKSSFREDKFLKSDGFQIMPEYDYKKMTQNVH